MTTQYTRWTVLLAGVLLQTSIGGIYAWSAFVPSLVEHHGFSRAQTGLLFGVQVIIFTITTLPAGKLLQKRGPRLTASIGAVLFGLGYVLASFAGSSFFGLLLSLGVITGMGIGMVYVCPLTTGMKWFPRNKGMVTGVAVAGFGAGAIALSAVAEYLMFSVGMGVFEVFGVAGFLFGGVALLSALFLRVPEESIHEQRKRARKKIGPALASPAFLVLVLGMFSGTFAGLLLNAHLKPFILNLGMGETRALLSISLFAVGNTAGRLSWGMIHDILGAKKTLLAAQTCMIAALGGILAAVHWEIHSIILTLVVCVGFGFGACFVIYAAAITDRFGVELLPRLYPFAFISYGLAALIGPSLGGVLADRTGTYSSALTVTLILTTVAFLFLMIHSKIQKPVSSGGTR